MTFEEIYQKLGAGWGLSNVESNLRDALPDAERHQAFLWDFVPAQGDSHTAYYELMFEYGRFLREKTVRQLSHDQLIAVLNAYARLFPDEESEGARGLLSEAANMVFTLAEKRPDLVESLDRLEAPVQGYAYACYVAFGRLEPAQMPESGWQYLARAACAQEANDVFSGFTEEMNAPAFAQRLLEVLRTDSTVRVMSKRAQLLLDALTLEELANVIPRTWLNMYPVDGLAQYAALIETHGAALIQAVLPSFEQEPVFKHSANASLWAMLCIEYCLANQIEVPQVLARAFGPLIPRCYVEELLPRLRAVAAALPAALVTPHLITGLKNASSNVSLGLIDRIEDEASQREALEAFAEAKLEKYHVDKLVKQFARTGQGGLDLLAARWPEVKLPSRHAESVTRGATLMSDVDPFPFFIVAMERGGKAPTELAQLQLVQAGEAAREALEVGAKSKKKSVREWCVSQLEALAALPTDGAEEGAPDALSELAARHPQLVAQLDKMVSSPNSIYDHDPLFARLRRSSNPPTEDDIEVWRLFLPRLLELSPNTYSSKRYIDLLKHLHEDLRAPLLEEVLALPLTRFGEGVLVHYLKKVDPAQPELVAKGLTASTKDARERALELAPRHLDALQETLLTLLASRKKDERITAAQVLASAKNKDLSAYEEALQSALASEKSAEVAVQLEQALVAAGGEVASASVDAEVVGVAALDALLAEGRKKKMPKYVDVSRLPALTWEDGTPLSDAARDGVLTHLALEGPDARDELVRQIRPRLDEQSAAEFSFALKEMWKAAGLKAGDKWIAYQEAILGSEARMNEFAPHLDNWAGQGRHHMAKWYLDVLARHGSLTGRSWVGHWARAAERQSIRQHARELIAAMASEVALSSSDYIHRHTNAYIADDVADAAVPTFGLEQPGGMSIALDAAGAQGTLRLDGNGRLVIRDARGKLHKGAINGMPAASEALFNRLAPQVERAVKQVIWRLEQNMVSGRIWDKARFERLFLQHPLLREVAGMVLFMTSEGELFHVNEGDLVNESWEVIELPTNAEIKIAHLLDLKEKNVDGWMAHMGEAEIIQPFAQLDRPLFAIGERPALDRKTTGGKLAGRLAALGWRNDSAEDAGMVYGASKLFPGRQVRAHVSHGGFYIGQPSSLKDKIEVHDITFYDMEDRPIAERAVDPIVYSEMMVELQRLTE